MKKKRNIAHYYYVKKFKLRSNFDFLDRGDDSKNDTEPKIMFPESFLKTYVRPVFGYFNDIDANIFQDKFNYQDVGEVVSIISKWDNFLSESVKTLESYTKIKLAKEEEYHQKYFTIYYKEKILKANNYQRIHKEDINKINKLRNVIVHNTHFNLDKISKYKEEILKLFNTSIHDLKQLEGTVIDIKEEEVRDKWFYSNIPDNSPVIHYNDPDHIMKKIDPSDKLDMKHDIEFYELYNINPFIASGFTKSGRFVGEWNIYYLFKKTETLEYHEGKCVRQILYYRDVDQAREVRYIVDDQVIMEYFDKEGYRIFQN